MKWVLVMEVPEKEKVPVIRSGSTLLTHVTTLLLGLVILSASATAQSTDQASENRPAGKQDLIPEETRRTALRHLREGNLEQLLQVLEGPGEWALPYEPVQIYAGLNRLLTHLDDDEQFEILHQWSLPGQSPKRVRSLTGMVSMTAPPAEFARALGERPRENSFPVASIGAVRGIFSTEWSLVLAAQKSGKLKRLTTELGALVDQKVAGAQLLLALARIADQRGDVSSVANRISERIGQLKANPSPAVIDSDDIVLAVSAVTRRELCSPGAELLSVLIQHTHGHPSPVIRPFLRQAHATACLLGQSDQTANDLGRVLAPRLKFWVNVERDLPESHANPHQGMSWLVHEDHILHLAGSSRDTLLMRYPLVGDFQLQFETQLDPQSQTNGSLSYAGLQFEPEQASNLVQITTAAGEVLATRTGAITFQSSVPTFNRLSVTSTPKNVTMAVNRHPLWVESTDTQTGPWIGLASRGDSNPLFRNIQVTGQPIIPRSVRMADAAGARNWVPHAWGDMANGDSQLKSEWTVAEGVIQAHREKRSGPPTDAADASRLAQHVFAYERPLLDGETVSYEFFYEPDVAEVHPALGRMGFLLRPDGVHIHWMTDGDDWTSLAADNSVVEPLCRRGPRPLPFKPSNWNRASLKRTTQSVTLSLNETVVYERPVDWGGDQRFGLYRHGTTTDVKVRRVELTGDWPQQLPPEFFHNPVATSGEPLTVPQRHGLHQIFQEEFLAENVFAVHHQAAAMPAVQRFDFLSRWVLPGPDHPGFRITGEFTQTQPAQVTQEKGLEQPERGGQLLSPVFDWLDTARELGRLADCLTNIETAAAPDTEPQRRARIGLQLLVNLEMGNQPKSTELFSEFYEMLRPPTADEQWPEMLVLDRAVHKFATNEAAAKFIADLRTLKSQQARTSGSPVWQAQISSLLAGPLAEKAGVAEARVDVSAINDWLPVTAATSATRGSGHPVARWVRQDHKMLKLEMQDQDFLFYRSPLGGNYEVEGDLIEAPQVMIGGSYLGARRDQRTLDLGTFRAAAASEPVDPPFSTFWLTVHFRAVVRDGIRSISINGRPVKSAKLPENSDPWLAIRCAGRTGAGIQNLRITGQPRVLEEVPLSSSAELTGWIAYFSEPVLQPTAGWAHVGGADSSGWIVGHPTPSATGMAIESLLRYQRPLVEDGSIQYEFFYEPGAFETHPALDRLALLLHPSGVLEHWIGDGRYDRTDLDPLNQTAVPACRRGPAELPLKAEAWNLLRLSFRGPVVTVELNGQVVYERTLEPTNLRTFGLFHFQGNSAVRVRNAVLRGEWPQTVPPLDGQALADDTVEKLDADLAGLKAEFTHNFQQAGIPDQYFKSPLPGPTLKVLASPQGVQASQRSAGPHGGFNIHPRFTLSGDFDIVAEFTGLRIEGSGDAGIMLNATLNEGQSHEYRALRMKTTAGNHDLHSSVSFARPDGGRTYVGDSKSFEALSGRIRLARHGQRVYYMFAENDSDHFFLFGSEPASPADTAVDGIFLHSFCNGVSISQVTWTRLSLRAERIRLLPR